MPLEETPLTFESEDVTYAAALVLLTADGPRNAGNRLAQIERLAGWVERKKEHETYSDSDIGTRVKAASHWGRLLRDQLPAAGRAQQPNLKQGDRFFCPGAERAGADGFTTSRNRHASHASQARLRSIRAPAERLEQEHLSNDVT